MRSITLLTVSAVLLMLPSAPGGMLRAAEVDYALYVGVPVTWTFSENDATGEPLEHKSTSGLRLMLTTPSRLGIGFASFNSGFNEPGTIFSGREIDYSLLEFQFTFPLDPVVLGIGFGLGGGEFTPESDGIVQMTVDSAQEWFLSAAYRITDTWDVGLSLHAIKADVKATVGSAEFAGDLGAASWVLSGGYHF